MTVRVNKAVNNQIDAAIKFSYQGETHSPRSTIDLDNMMEGKGQLSDLYTHIAKENNIDTYSYLYEVMESYEIEYSNAQGLAQQCLEGDQFDFARFEQLWHEAREVRALAGIARKQLGIDDLDKEAKIKQALLDAYHLGKSAN